MSYQVPLKQIGEDRAAAFLRRRGFRLVARNWRTKFGELDLVMMDGKTLVFVEVKARSSSQAYDPALAVNYPKQRRIRRLAEFFLVQNPNRFADCRFDVVSVVASGPRVEVKHIPDAF